MSERWLPVPKFPEAYEVSESGKVRRILGGPGKVAGKMLKGRPDKDGYWEYLLMHNAEKWYVRAHRSVCEAFNGPAPEGKPLVLHFDGDVTNNHISNLRWGDLSDNQADAIRHGTHWEAGRTHCIRGHEFTEENTYRGQPGKRACITCRRNAAIESYRRNKKGESA